MVEPELVEPIGAVLISFFRLDLPARLGLNKDAAMARARTPHLTNLKLDHCRFSVFLYLF
jgi:hypothetical protein